LQPPARVSKTLVPSVVLLIMKILILPE
jgi:hypothetical protein